MLKVAAKFYFEGDYITGTIYLPHWFPQLFSRYIFSLQICLSLTLKPFTHCHLWGAIVAYRGCLELGPVSALLSHSRRIGCEHNFCEAMIKQPIRSTSLFSHRF